MVSLDKQLIAVGLPAPTMEFRFDDKRRFRFDYCYPDKKLAIEIEGGVFVKSRHTSGTGYTRDCEKYNLAVLNGWRVLRFTTAHVKSGYALTTIEEAFKKMAP